MSPSQGLLSVDGLRVTYRGNSLSAVCGVTFGIQPGECLALVGESGSGKSTIAMAVGRLTDLTGARVEGKIIAAGRDVLSLDPEALRVARKNIFAYVFQEPASSLNPVLRVNAQFYELFDRPDSARVIRLLEDVRIRDAARVAASFPHELSGGMQQRVMIALALAKDAKLLIADEPTTALDATVQCEVLALLKELKQSRGLSILLVTHDLWAARETADRILVLRAGEVVEELRRENYDNPVRPYTRALLAAALLDGEPKKPIPVDSGTRS